MKYIAYRIIKFILKPIFIIIYRPKYIGRENIPSSGPVILAGNHTHNLDAVIMISGPKRIVHMMSKKELFDKFFKRLFFRSMACIPVDRSIHDESAKNEAIKVLKNNEVLGIFPEGTVNKTNDIVMPFKYGAVSFAKKTNSLIVPFSITGKYKIGGNIKNTIVFEDSLYAKENNILMNKVINLIKGDNNEKN